MTEMGAIVTRRKSKRSLQPDSSDTDSESSAVARRVILDTVENQLRNNDPPETQHTMNRLMAMGHTRSEALGFIGAAIAIEIYEIAANEGTFDEPRYLANLQALPHLPE
ncbi:MAG: hypothetical protein WBD34_00095 [Burkholderiaceae bacterium]